ncbi:hypothetical protein PANDA_017955, partial [Ailuropoda melanoleuca]
QISEQFKFCPKHSYNTPILPLPTNLPPFNKVRWDTLRTWCQQLNLSTDGRKIEVYLRLQKHAYPEKNQNIPETSLEAKLQSCSRKGKMVAKKAKLWKSCKKREREEESNTVEVVTSAQEGMLAAWSRIAARANQSKSVNSRSIPASVETFLLQASGKINLKRVSIGTAGWL